MIKFAKKIKILINDDQNIINQYKNGDISRNDWVSKSKLISDSFLEILKRGFPYHDEYQEEIYEAAIALALHLDFLDLKSVYRRQIQKATSEQILNKHRIIFIDKIRVLSGRLQLYGSQYKISRTHKVKLLPIEKKKDVNKRRKRLGLETVENYIESINI